MGTPQTVGVMWPISHVWATADFVPRSEALVTTPPNGRGDEANLPTCEPVLIMSLALKCWGPQTVTGDVANLPNYGPLLILSPALKRW